MSHEANTPEPVEGAAKPAIDLSQLATARRPAGPTSSPVKARRRWLTRYVLPLGILAAFAGMFAWAARDSFLPAHAITITPVLIAKAEIQQSGTPLFQAAGWIEPRPTPVIVSSLAAGVVEALLVVEGQSVELGQPVAKLIDTDAKLEVQKAETNLKLCAAEIPNAEARLTAARIALEKPNDLRAALAEAESLLAETRLTLGNLPYTVEAANTRYQLASDNVDRKSQAGDAIAGKLLAEAKAELASSASGLAELKARSPILSSQLDALERRRTALGEQLSLMSEQKRAVAEAQADLVVANVRREQAQLALDTVRLNLERMTICAPITGRVLTVDARPGRRLMGLDPSGQQDSSAVISMYDPEKLQVRVDVRLEDVPHVQIGQPASIETAALAKPLSGQVLWVTTRADIQKNTLQVKVAINDPGAMITPEMLGQVTFLAPPQTAAADADKQEPLRLLVPRQLLSGGEGTTTIWVADVTKGVARQKTIQLGRAGTDQLVEVSSGLTPTDKLIVGGRESLSEGARIRVVGADQSLGLSPQVAAGHHSDNKK